MVRMKDGECKGCYLFTAEGAKLSLLHGDSVFDEEPAGFGSSEGTEDASIDAEIVVVTVVEMLAAVGDVEGVGAALEGQEAFARGSGESGLPDEVGGDGFGVEVLALVAAGAAEHELAERRPPSGDGAGLLPARAAHEVVHHLWRAGEAKLLPYHALHHVREPLAHQCVLGQQKRIVIQGLKDQLEHLLVHDSSIGSSHSTPACTGKQIQLLPRLPCQHDDTNTSPYGHAHS
jgi:hypothetical protein